jgi:sodium pump decarboxylase gamma subunit
MLPIAKTPASTLAKAMLQEAFVVLVIGMTTVMAFLLLLVWLIDLMGRLVAAFLPPEPAVEELPAAEDETRLAVAIAAARRARG